MMNILRDAAEEVCLNITFSIDACMRTTTHRMRLCHWFLVGSATCDCAHVTVNQCEPCSANVYTQVLVTKCALTDAIIQLLLTTGEAATWHMKGWTLATVTAALAEATDEADVEFLKWVLTDLERLQQAGETSCTYQMLERNACTWFIQHTFVQVYPCTQFSKLVVDLACILAISDNTLPQNTSSMYRQGW
jgi:hypothetical protein